MRQRHGFLLNVDDIGPNSVTFCLFCVVSRLGLCRALLCLSSLQPPLCVSVELSVGQVAKKMAEIRTDAVILLGPQGDMKGIMTDHDVAR